MTRVILPIILSIFIFSCSNTVEFEPKKYHYTSKKDCNLKENCANAYFKILYTDNKSNISDSVNVNLIKIVKENLFYDKQYVTVTNHKGLGRKFINQYHNDKFKSKEENFSSYYLNVWHVLGYQSEKLLNLHVNFEKDINESEKYFGVLSLLIEKETGRKIPCYKLFKDKELENVMELAESAFREKFKIEFGESYNKNGYFFKNNKFELPENIFLVKENVLFIYNPYEIANISKGNIAFQIPYKDIAKYMAIR